MQQAVLQARAARDDMLGELETPLEGARRNALMQELAVLSFNEPCFAPRTVRAFSRVSIESSSFEKPATASVTR